MKFDFKIIGGVLLILIMMLKFMLLLKMVQLKLMLFMLREEKIQIKIYQLIII